jgi:GT2 family glycosyltransferase
MTALISIVMPCFNAEKHLPTSISSLMAQTLGDWELIAVDDGSVDGTLNWLQAQTDPRIRVITQQNAGVSAARNAGLAACSGQYVAFLDADDTWAPRFLEATLNALHTQPDRVLAYCGWQNLGIEGARGDPFVPPDYEGPGKTLALLGGCRWPIHACLTRREAIEAAGRFDTRLKIGEDYLLWMEVAARGAIVRVPEVLAYYHHHGVAQATGNRVLAATDTLKAKQIFLEHHPEVEHTVGRKNIEELTWGALIRQGSELYWRGDLVSARPLLRKALLAGHGKPKDWMRMLPCLLPLPLHRLVMKILAE